MFLLCQSHSSSSICDSNTV